MYTVVYSKNVSMRLEAIKFLLYTTVLSANILFIFMELMWYFYC
jgi:hypothetical protein